MSGRRCLNPVRPDDDTIIDAEADEAGVRRGECGGVSKGGEEERADKEEENKEELSGESGEERREEGEEEIITRKREDRGVNRKGGGLVTEPAEKRAEIAKYWPRVDAADRKEVASYVTHLVFDLHPNDSTRAQP